jgi:hypothetical protein
MNMTSSSEGNRSQAGRANDQRLLQVRVVAGHWLSLSRCRPMIAVLRARAQPAGAVRNLSLRSSPATEATKETEAECLGAIATLDRPADGWSRFFEGRIRPVAKRRTET